MMADGLELHVVTGNPGAGKTTLVGAKAVDGDTVLDFDRLAMAAGSRKKRGHEQQHLAAARIMWGALTRSLGSMRGRVWLIHGYPSDEARKRYRELGARFHDLSGGTARKDPKDYAPKDQRRSVATAERTRAPAAGSGVGSSARAGVLELPPAVKAVDPYRGKDGAPISLLRPAGSTRAWRKLRAEVLERDHHRCGYCGAPATTVDHKIPRVKGGTDKLSNLIASCWTCNLAKGGGRGQRK